MDTPDKIVEQIPRLRRYARALVDDVNQADDLVQDCLTRALSRLSLWKEDGDMRAWLFTIMHNLFVNECKKMNRRPQHHSLSLVAERPQVSSEPEHSVVISELEHALTKLQHEHREVIVLVGLEGMSYQQAADILSIPKGTVMSRLHRGRNALCNTINGNKDDKAGLRSI